MSRCSVLLVTLLAIFAMVLAQTDSSSTADMVLDSSSSAELVVDSSSSTVMVDDSSSSSEVVLDSSSSTVIANDSSSGANDIPSFLPDGWEDASPYDNNTVFTITWGTKSDDNAMRNYGIADGFYVDGVSGRFLKLALGNYYTFQVDITVPSSFYLTTIPEGNQAAGNITTPIAPGTNYTYLAGSNSDATVIYYASTTDSYAGGAIALTQAATALQISFLMMAVSAFVALVFPKW